METKPSPNKEDTDRENLHQMSEPTAPSPENEVVAGDAKLFFQLT